jgi:hypothetical protein
MGVWAKPDTIEKAQEFASRIQTPIRADEAVGKLYHLVGDDDFFDAVDNFVKHGEGYTDVSEIAAEKVEGWANNPQSFYAPWEFSAAAICKAAVADCKAWHQEAMTDESAHRM